MICPKCGRTVPDGMPCPCGAPMLSSNPAVNLIKTLGSSTKFLAATILYSAMVLFAIFAAFGSKALVDQLYYYGANYGVDPDVFYPMMSALEGFTTAGLIFTLIPAILVAVGMWLFYSTCRNRQTGNVSTVGLTICKVLAIISLVMICVIIALVLFIMVVVMVVLASNMGYSYYYNATDNANVLIFAQVFLGIFAVVLAAMLVLYILYYVSVIKVINRIKASAINGVPDNRIPRFLTGFLMFLGVMNALGGVASLITSPIAGVGSLAGAACFILMSLLLKEYRDKMTVLLFPPVQPMYGNMPPYNTVPPQQPSGQDGNIPQ